MITVEHLTFEYPGIRALDDVSFRIEKGTITALVGPNGAGKTTLMRCIAALDQPMAGRITVADIDVLEYPRECHRVIGYLSDFFGLYQRLTLAQCLRYVARAQGLSADQCDDAIQRVAHALGLADRLHMHPGELSRGLRQRLAIAQAIIHDPPVVLLDEPASGLDPEARHELEQLFLALQRQGMTLLVSSHILAELENYCSDMLVLRQGRIVEQTGLLTPKRGHNVRLALAQPVTALSSILSGIAGIGQVNVESPTSALVELPESADEQAAILRRLIDADLPICEFARVTVNMQDVYLNTIRPRLSA